MIVLMNIADLLFLSLEAFLKGLGTRLLCFYELISDFRLLGLRVLQVVYHSHFYEF
jgi:hypothetical protein